MKVIVVVALLAAGCSTDPTSESRELCTARPIGDVRMPIELELVSRRGDVHAPVMLSSGTSGLALSIRARNLDGCAIAVAMQVAERDDLRGGTMVQLDADGEVDPDDPLQFVELPGADRSDTIAVVIQDAQGRWASASYPP